MNQHLRPCPSCARHVRTTDVGCPFCAALLPASVREAAAPAMPVGRLSRAALFAFGVKGLPACDDENGGGGTRDAAADVPVDQGGAMPVYGGPPVPEPKPDASVGPVYGGPPTPDAADAGDAGDARDAADSAPDQSIAPVYGGPPVEPRPDGGVAPVYGGPPVDPGPDGGVAPAYGLPPG